jgi:nucleotide-binding universal stress UspA family protein
MNYTTSRILVPHDGSEMSDKALNKAIEFATALKSEMIISHVIDDTLILQGAIIVSLAKNLRLRMQKQNSLNSLRLVQKLC